MNKELEEHQASPELQKFFERLLELKYDIKLMMGQHDQSQVENPQLKCIYDRLNDLIKEKA